MVALNTEFDVLTEARGDLLSLDMFKENKNLHEHYKFQDMTKIRKIFEIDDIKEGEDK